MIKRKVAVMLSILIISGLSLTGCGGSKAKPAQPQSQTQTQSKDTKQTTNVTNANQQLVDSQKKQINELTEEVNYYKNYVKDITKTMSPEKMNELVNKEWIYSLSVNKIAFPTNGVLEISDTSFDLILSEQRVKYSVLPDAESLKGKIKSDVKSAIQVSSEPKVDTTGTLTTATYSFKDLKSGDCIKMKIAGDLKTKLGFITDQLEIRIK